MIRTDYFETSDVGFAVIVKDIVDYAVDYIRYVKFGASTLTIGAFQVTEEGCDVEDNPYRFFVAGTADVLNNGGYSTSGNPTNFIAKFSIFQEGMTQISGAEQTIESEHYGYDLYAQDDKAVEGQFVAVKYQNEGWNPVAYITWSDSLVETLEEVELKFFIIDYYDFIHEGAGTHPFSDSTEDVGSFKAPRIYDIEYFIGYGVKYYQFDTWPMTSALDEDIICTDVYMDYDLYIKSNVTYNETTNEPIYWLP